MSKLKELIHKHPYDFLAIAKAITCGNDLLLQNTQGHTVLEILLDEYGNATTAEQQSLYEAWLRRLLRYYKYAVDLNKLLHLLLSQKEVNLKVILFLIRSAAPHSTVTPAVFSYFADPDNFHTKEVKELVLIHGVPVDTPVQSYDSRKDQTSLGLLLDKYSQEKENSENTLKAIKTLIELGANVNTQNANGDTLLHLLIRKMGKSYSPDPYVNKLISKYGASLKICNNKGESLLSIPEYSNFSFTDSEQYIDLKWILRLIDIVGGDAESIIQKIIDKKVNEIFIGDNVPLLHCFTNPFDYCALSLLKFYGADFNVRSPAKQGGRTALELLLNQAQPDFPAMMHLVELGANPNSTNSKGETLLHLLIKEYVHTHKADVKERITRLVSVFNADLSVNNREAQTPLQWVLDCNQKIPVEDFMLLIRLGADANTRTKNNTPLLHRLALRANHIGFIEEIVSKHQADINSKNKNKQTILDIALSKEPRDIAIIQRYIAWGAACRPSIEQILTRINCLTLAEIKRMEKEGLAPNKYLYDLLINKKASDCSNEFYKNIKDYKETFLRYINTLPMKQRVHALLKALDPNSALGGMIWWQRGWFKPRLTAGNLLACHNALKQGLQANPTLLNDPGLLLEILNHNTLPLETKLLSKAAFKEYLQSDKLSTQQKEQRMEFLLDPAKQELVRLTFGLTINKQTIYDIFIRENTVAAAKKIDPSKPVYPLTPAKFVEAPAHVQLPPLPKTTSASAGKPEFPYLKYLLKGGEKPPTIKLSPTPKLSPVNLTSSSNKYILDAPIPTPPKPLQTPIEAIIAHCVFPSVPSNNPQLEKEVLSDDKPPSYTESLKNGLGRRTEVLAQ